MADYFAVLQRTLSGFSDPKPELRAKLYERARSTIERQLASRTPPITGEALTLEMDRLQQAIVDIEGQYKPVVEEQQPDPQPEIKPEIKPEVQPEAQSEIQPAPLEELAAVVEEPIEPEPAPPPSPPLISTPPENIPVEPEPTPDADMSPAPVTAPEPEIVVAPPVEEVSAQPEFVTLQPEPEFEPEPAPEPTITPVEETVETPEQVEALEPPPIPIFDVPASDPIEESQPTSEPDLIPDLALEIPTLPLTTPPAAEEPPIPVIVPEAEPVIAAPAAVDEPSAVDETPPVEAVADPVEEWAKEFLTHEPAPTPAPQPAPVSAEAVAPPIQEPTPPPIPQVAEHGALLVPQAPEPTAAESQSAATAIPPAHELPPFDPAADDDLGIPPAPGFSPRTPRRSTKRGGFKWLIVIILLGAIAAAGYFGWQSRTNLIETFGLSKWFVDPQDPQTPKKVKTITIKPDPEEPEAEPAEPVKPKTETRIPVEGATTPTDKGEIKPTAVDTVIPVSQNAVLYEEGATAADSSIDKGRVVWSVAQQAPLEGLPAEPAIQGRVEVPSRNLVLNLIIKRNADKSLPASHVIELNFTVPKDFSGGAVGQIRSLVSKSSEQGQGKALIGVPVQLADGQFILALNNLESAQKTNVELLKNSGWIDVPMLYRTGRRAFITIEKGAPGDKIFKEVFEAWGQ